MTPSSPYPNLDSLIIKVPGVSGIAWSDAGVSVLLVVDDEVVKAAVQQILTKHGIDLPVWWKVTGTFELL